MEKQSARDLVETIKYWSFALMSRRRDLVTLLSIDAPRDDLLEVVNGIRLAEAELEVASEMIEERCDGCVNPEIIEL